MTNKGLEALEVLKNRALSDLESIPKNAIPICEKSNEEVMKTYETIKQALLKAQEQEKVLKIIKEKSVLIACLINANTLEDYNCQVMSWNKLYQEEFDLLKEVLECQKD